IAIALAVSTPAFAGTFDATATSTGSRIDIALVNRSTAEIEMHRASEGGVIQYGGLVVDLAGAAPRRLGVVDPAPGKLMIHPVDTIAPGKTLVIGIDVQRYAILYDNGGPLPPGDYTATIRWTQPCAGCSAITATTKLTIAAPVEKHCTESPPSTTGLA